MRAWIVLVLWCQVARAEAPKLPERGDRLVALARVWGHAKYFHPALATRDIDWDAALAGAIPKVEAATTIEQYRAAVGGMLAVIGDPLTKVVDATPETPPAAAPKDWISWPDATVAEARMAAFASAMNDYVGTMQKAQQLVSQTASAKVLILDLRGTKEELGFVFDRLLPLLPAFDEWPTFRVVEHRGFRTQDGTTTGDYFSTFVVTGARPPHPPPAHGPAHVVFVLDAEAKIPAVARALQAAGKATFVAQGTLRADSDADTEDLELGGGLTARLRLSEPLWGAPTADVVVAAGKDPLVRAREIAKHPPRTARRAKAAPALLPLRVRDDADYADAPLPTRERRLLAGMRMWAIVELFEPYRYLAGDWDAALRDALPRLDQAADAAAYLRALKELAARVGDGHVGVYPAVRTGPRAMPPLEPRLVGGKLVITRVIDNASSLGLAAGDVIETIDGTPAAQAIADARLITSGSTDEARDQRAAENALAGDDGTPLKLAVRDARGAVREITATRTRAHAMALWSPSSGPHWKKLAGNIGFVDLRELTVGEVPAMFKDLGTSKAIVFDMRGYPNGTAWAIAPRINTKHAKHGAQFLAPLVRGDGVRDAEDLRVRFLQPLPPLAAGDAIYPGKIVVLVDDRAISQAEHTCLFFEQAAGATFVGSPTHGANGDVTVLRLPGGLRMSFTGQEVRHVDGRQLQRVGIQPQIVVRPTLAGIRAGKDEVLDRALTFLATGR